MIKLKIWFCVISKTQEINDHMTMILILRSLLYHGGLIQTD